MPTAEDLLYHEEGGEAFLLHVPSGRYFGLNPAGVVVFEALRDGRDPVGALRQRWPGQSEEKLAADTAHLVEMFKEAGLPAPPGRPTQA